MTRPASTPACRVDPGLPDCATGPAGRLGFVLREARAAWRRRTALRTSTNDTRSAGGNR